MRRETKDERPKTSLDWGERARLFGERFPRAVLHPAFVNWVESGAWRGTAGVACSGGADSLALLLLVWAQFPERRGDLLVLHFDHRLRGEASESDARFVETVAGGLGLSCRRGVWEREPDEAVTEMTARDARFAFFRRELRGKGDVLFLGHQRDDILETMLMRLARGSGTGGLAAPRPVQRFRDGRIHLRPLLRLPGAEIREALEELSIPFCEDATNAELFYLRNRIRNAVAPVWREHAGRDVAAGVAASRELLEEDDEALTVWLRCLLPEAEAGRALDLTALGGKPRALFRRAVQEWLALQGLGERLSRQAVERLLEAAVAGRAYRGSAGSDAFLVLAEDRSLRIEGSEVPEATIRFQSPWPLPNGGEILLPGGKRLRARVIEIDDPLRARVLAGKIDPAEVAIIVADNEMLSVRQWREGDRYRPLGAPGTRKVQDLFVDRKIPVRERGSLPVVCAGNRIVWIPGFPPAESLKINELTKKVVQLTYDGRGAV